MGWWLSLTKAVRFLVRGFSFLGTEQGRHLEQRTRGMLLVKSLENTHNPELVAEDRCSDWARGNAINGAPGVWRDFRNSGWMNYPSTRIARTSSIHRNVNA
jgi:hypothetical protein